MSFEAAAWAIKQRPKTATAKLLLIMLADCHNAETGRCDPSLKFLCTGAICAKSTAVNSLNALETAGYITRTPGGVFDGKNVSTKYHLKMLGVVHQMDPLPNSLPITPETLGATGLQAVNPAVSGGSPSDGLGGPITGQPLVHLMDQGSPSDGHKPGIKSIVIIWSPDSITLDACKMSGVHQVTEEMIARFRVKILDWNDKGYKVNLRQKFITHCKGIQNDPGESSGKRDIDERLKTTAWLPKGTTIVCDAI